MVIESRALKNLQAIKWQTNETGAQLLHCSLERREVIQSSN